VVTNIRELLYRYLWRSAVLLVRTHTCDSFGSNGAAAATTAARAYRHSRLNKNSAELRDSELEALYERRGPRRHVLQIRSNKLRDIDNRRRAHSRAKSRVRALVRLYFLCSRVCTPCISVRYTGTRLPTTLLRSLRFFCSTGRADSR